MNTVFVNHPYVLEHHLKEISDEENDQLIEQSIKADEIGRPELDVGAYNVRMDKTDVTNKLKSAFDELCYEYFFNITKVDRNCDRTSDACTYVSTNTRFDAVWHNHQLKCSINSVYYAQLPDEDGTLSIMDNDGVEKRFLPLERYIYLMPGWMIHKPNPCRSNTPRVSINMEFLTLEKPILKPDHWDDEQYGIFGQDQKAYVMW
jgi:hypothetical protein